MSVLKQRDYLVVGAASVEQARWWLGQWPIDLMVAAVRIAGIGGLQFLTATRVQHPELAGILVGSEHGVENLAGGPHGSASSSIW